MNRRRIPHAGVRKSVRDRAHLESNRSVERVAFSVAGAAAMLWLSLGCTTDIGSSLRAGAGLSAGPTATTVTPAPSSTGDVDPCNDGVKGEQESAIDCGGNACPACGVGLSCLSDRDCNSGVCFEECIPAGCSNQFRDPDETDSDCGGVCEPCADGLECDVARDCQSGVCSDDRCQLPSCDDGVKNGLETGRDCGASSTCGLCPLGRDCEQDQDCDDALCISGECSPRLCVNKRIDETETDVDCGGACPACDDGYHCAVSSDCQSNSCTLDDDEMRCQIATCDDGVQNGDESDTDCGGSCPERCEVGRLCSTAEDCADKVCRQGADDEAERCKPPACEDGVKNGDESAIDCGGSCAPCATDETCLQHEDCQSNSCGGVCLAPSCEDDRLNSDESDVDCGGACAPCATGDGCATETDCVTSRCGGDGRCEPSSPGGACQGNADCLSDGCIEQVCELSARGEACRAPEDCTTATCADSECQASSTGGACAAHTDCSSGICEADVCERGALGSACQSEADCFSGVCAEAGCAALELALTTSGVQEQAMVVVQFAVAAGSAASAVNWEDIAVLYFFSPEVRTDLQPEYQSSNAARSTTVGIDATNWVYVWQHSSTGPVSGNPFSFTIQIHDATWGVLTNADDYSYQATSGPNPNLVVCYSAGGSWHHVQGTPPESVPNPCQYVEPDCEAVVCDDLNQ